MPPRSKEKEKKKKKETEKEKDLVVASLRPCELDEPVDKVFSHWKQIMHHPDAMLDKKRRAIIQGALKSGYEVEQLCQAISGCSYTGHNMGDNDRGQRYDGLHVILRDGDQIDRFIRNYQTPPKRVSQHEQLNQRNSVAIQTWLAQEEESHGGA